MSLVKISINSFATFSIGFPFRDEAKFLAPYVKYCLRQGIEQAKGQRLSEAFLIKMREVAALVPLRLTDNMVLVFR